MSAPGVTVEFENPQAVYLPCDNLAFSCRLTDDDARELEGMEVAVLWCTHGKGDQDTGVHFFEKLTKEQVEDGQTVRRFSTSLPATPLSYDGLILQIGWCVRVRAFFRGGNEVVAEVPFRLGRSFSPAPR